MGSKEIKITEYAVEDCKGNLNSLVSQWNGAPNVDTGTLQESSGSSQESLKSCLEITGQVTASMNQLLTSTLAFCTSMGIAFKESDEQASKNINSITGNG